MQRNPQFLGNMNMAKAGWIRDNSVGHKRPVPGVTRQRVPLIHGHVSLVWQRRDTHAVASLDTRPPAPRDNLLDLLAALLDIAALERVEARHQPGVLDHEGHQLRRVSADVEELEPILLDERPEVGVGRYANTVAVRVAEHLAQGHKGLHVASRSNDLDHHVQARRGCLAGQTA
jgi:hypothetical protein